jgi:cyclophilin family peptidyl-prolyl cis-trans isomerase
MAMRLAAVLLSLILTPIASFGQTSDATPAPAPTSASRVRVFTTAGSFVIELDRSRAPLTVEAFVGYVSKGFYNGTIFHRVVAGFIAQAGGYTADFAQKPVTETVFNESGNGLSNIRGTVGFARSNDPHSGTSQFYVNLSDNVDLNPRPTRWGSSRAWKWSTTSATGRRAAAARSTAAYRSSRSRSRASRFCPRLAPRFAKPAVP